MARKRSTTHPASQQPKPQRRIHDEAPGRRKGKLPGVAVCPECGASHQDGRWTWDTPPAGCYEHTCPACEAIAADYPAAVLHVEGAFAAEHRNELVSLIRNLETRERAEHPLNRVISIRDEGSGFLVKTTSAKLAETFGRALESAYDGRYEHPPSTSEKGNLTRLRWTRD